MLINNPTYTIRLIDLVSHDDSFFTMEDLYIQVNKWLIDLKPSFYTSDNTEWEKFIERMCNRFYSRNLNFDTYYEFKIKLRDCLDTYRDRIDRYVSLQAKDINPWSTYGDTSTEKGQNHGQDNGQNTTTTTNISATKGTSTGTDTSNSTSYNLHSDTPASTVNIKNMFDGSEYVTDAQNEKSNSTNTSNGSNTSNTESQDTSKGSNMNTSDSTHLIDRITSGYQGNPLEILDRIDRLTIDVVNKYLDYIEDCHLFSNILY